ncbi:hypothetical protein [Paenibacillus sp. RC84]|uniref:hypothetical protein n=1 Tax=Paenibacillus sp. RC84 TaxID=3156252 RepID=UPI003510DDF1
MVEKIKTEHYHVISAFIDETGETIQPGALHEADEERAKRLLAAEVIGKVATKADIDAAKKAAEAEPGGGKDAGNA